MITDEDIRRIAAGVRGIMVKLPDGRERSLEWTLRWCYGHITGAKKLITAQQPLLEAAAQGQPLTADQVAQVAAQVAAAVGPELADEVADELSGRLAAGST